MSFEDYEYGLAFVPDNGKLRVVVENVLPERLALNIEGRGESGGSGLSKRGVRRSCGYFMS